MNYSDSMPAHDVEIYMCYKRSDSYFTGKSYAEKIVGTGKADQDGYFTFEFDVYNVAGDYHLKTSERNFEKLYYIGVDTTFDMGTIWN